MKLHTITLTDEQLKTIALSLNILSHHLFGQTGKQAEDAGKLYKLVNAVNQETADLTK